MEGPTTVDAVAALESGSVIGIPTDTVYGIAADPFQVAAVSRLFSIKGRPGDKPIGLLAADIESALRLVVLPDYAIQWTRSFWPGALNLVAAARFELPIRVGDHERGTVAVRVPDHDLARQILSLSGPLAVTSANRSGEPEAFDDEVARSLLGDLVDLYVVGQCFGGVASTTVDVSGPEPLLLRPGPLDLGL